jgi:hypothetical protein
MWSRVILWICTKPFCGIGHCLYLQATITYSWISNQSFLRKVGVIYQNTRSYITKARTQKDKIWPIFGPSLRSTGVCDNEVGWCTALQTGRMRIRFQVGSLKFCYCGRLRLWHERVPAVFPWGKGGRFIGLTTYPSICADCLKILGAYLGLYKESCTFISGTHSCVIWPELNNQFLGTDFFFWTEYFLG